MDLMKRKTILITGGAGYIGSHTAFLLAQQGHSIIILDTFVHKQLFAPSWATVIRGDFANTQLLDSLFEQYDIDAVMHFAAFIEVGLSVINPKEFYDNNVTKTLALLDAMLRHNVKTFVFSSSCAIYGNPVQLPMNEQHPKNPISPYGKTKLAIECALEDYSTAYGLNYVSLRYFNAAGAVPEIGLGEQHVPETHLVPRMIHSMMNHTPFTIYGTDYATPDGSCIRDYVHVLDIAGAHLKALEHLDRTKTSDFFNVGTGTGQSVLEMIQAIQRLSRRALTLVVKDRRQGDPETLVADPSKAHKLLGWQPRYSSPDYIVSSALSFASSQHKPLSHEFSEII